MNHFKMIMELLSQRPVTTSTLTKEIPHGLTWYYSKEVIVLSETNSSQITTWEVNSVETYLDNIYFLFYLI